MNILRKGFCIQHHKKANKSKSTVKTTYELRLKNVSLMEHIEPDAETLRRFSTLVARSMVLTLETYLCVCLQTHSVAFW